MYRCDKKGEKEEKRGEKKRKLIRYSRFSAEKDGGFLVPFRLSPSEILSGSNERQLVNLPASPLLAGAR